MHARFQQKTIPVSDVLPNPKNPRIDLRPGMPLYEKLRESIKHFSYVDPIIWNENTKMIVSGHQRFQVMKDLAEESKTPFDTIDVMAVSMTSEEQDTFMVAVNKITGLWDSEKLEALFRDLSEESLSLTGFEDFEINALIGEDKDAVLDSLFDSSESDKDIPKKHKTYTCPHCGKEFEI